MKSCRRRSPSSSRGAESPLFDPATLIEEDDELSQRITRAGDIVAHRTETSSFEDLFRRHYQLAKSRARRTVKERKPASIRALGPLAIVLGGGALVATSSVP